MSSAAIGIKSTQQDNGWTPIVDKFLIKIKNECLRYERSHRKRETYSRRKNTYLNIAQLGLSGTAALGALVFFEDCQIDPGTYCSQYFNITGITIQDIPDLCGVEKWIRLTAGMVTVFSTIIGGITLFLEYPRKAESDKESADEYGSLARTITLLLSVPYDQRDAMQPVVSNIKDVFDRIMQRSRSLDEPDDAGRSFTQSMQNLQPPNPTDITFTHVTPSIAKQLKAWESQATPETPTPSTTTSTSPDSS